MAASGPGVCHLQKIISKDLLGSDILWSPCMINSIVKYDSEMGLLVSDIF